MWETETVLAQYNISMEMRLLRSSHHLTQWYGYARQQIIRAYLVSVHGTDEHDQEGHVGPRDAQAVGHKTVRADMGNDAQD
ncbi:MAG: hypothetical protein ACI9YU_001631 [Flavobacteriales bacterium]|jgi:hypothetical protein